MKKNSLSDLTIGNLPVQILLFSIPLILSNFLQVFFNLADVAVVGRFAGSDALGAIGSTTTLVSLFTYGLFGLGAGINALVAQSIGSRDDKGIKEMVHSGFIVSIFAGLLFTLIGFFFSKDILLLLNTKPELIEGSLRYLRIYFIGMPFTAIYNFGNAVFSANGDTKKPLLFLSIAGVLNLIGNLFFVIVLKIDVTGVALASIISQFTSAVLIITALSRRTDDSKLTLNLSFITTSKVSKILALSVPAMLQNMVFSISSLFVQKGVNTFDALTVKGNSAAMNSDSIVYNIMEAFYAACGSFVGQNYGAGNKKRMLQSYLLTLAYAFGTAIVIGSGLALSGTHFLMLFTTEMAVAVAGLPRLVTMGFSYCVSAFMDNTIAAARALGYTVVPTIIVILGSCVFRIIWIETVFAHYQSMTSLYLVYVVSWVITSIFEIIYFTNVYRFRTREL